MTESNNSEGQARRPRRRTRTRSRSGSSRSVPLHKRVVSHFQAGDRKRGSDYVLEGRVEMEMINGNRAIAEVKGKERDSYGVGLDWSRVSSDRVLHAFCGCQRFAQGRPCKHLWATLLALAESGAENQPPGGDRLKLHKDRAVAWRELGIPVSDDDQEEDLTGRSRSRSGRRKTRNRKGRGRNNSGPTWRSQLAAVRQEVERLAEPAAEPEKEEKEETGPEGVVFLVNTRASASAKGLVLDAFGQRGQGQNGAGKLKRIALEPDRVESLLFPAPHEEEEEPRQSLALITALPAEQPGGQGRGGRGRARATPNGIRRLRLPARLYDVVLPHLCEQEALGWWDGRRVGNKESVAWDGGDPWHLVLRLEVTGAGSARICGGLERQGETVALTDPVLILSNGADPERSDKEALVLFSDRLARLEVERGDVYWIEALREAGEIAIPREDLEEALTSLLELPGLPRFVAPEELQISQGEAEPQPRVVLEPDPASIHPEPPFLVELSFLYGDLEVSAGDPRPTVVDWEERRFVRRDMEAEHEALVRLLELGPQPIASGQGHGLELGHRELPMMAEPLLLDGWTVEVRGTTLRPPSPPSLRVESGIDWFELSGSFDFDGDPVELQAVLDAVSRGDRFVELGDGSQGLLPASWMETYDSLAKLAHSSSEEGLRYLPSQALLVDALLATAPASKFDSGFAELREKLQSFERIKPKRELKSFEGELRGYQRDGLGWLDFLREYGLGGVLADDMGLGKTVQVLALIQAHRTPAKSTKRPFLVVAPRSLVYNWMDETARFTPKLKIVEYLGPEREAIKDKLDEYDIVVTTYGTLRRDIGFLATVEFDTAILDEAQAIKNSDSQTAKASRLLVARHRLALTGTPIENHLGELGSIFEFLNPGLLGRLPKLEALASGGAPSRGQLELVAKGVKPFILRRTKAQVLADLPPKTEQVLLCTLSDRQRELYDQLRASYQASLLKQVESQGLAKSTMQVLEALLRLRQVACHPGLVNEDWEEAGSSKLDSLFDQVAEVLDEGHKVLVFSQFTKLLGFVRRRLDEQETPYAYLDGKTRDRGEVVERFQNDPDCNLFLVSLKAGGVGLNLTAAGYVFLLDPWWNPAVEAQAIDRAHRIGQTQPVFAYRMIARDTVEEKILELQKSKLQIAEAILGDGEGEGQSLRDLTADDLRMLLS